MEKLTTNNIYATNEITARFSDHDFEIIQRMATEQQMTMDQLFLQAISV